MVTAGSFGALVTRVPSFVVERPLLVAQLESATRRRLVRIVAPAGYGKSVLLAQWNTTHRSRRVVWLSARPTDDGVQIARRLVDAVEQLLPGGAGHAVDHIRPDGSALGEDFLAAILAVLADIAPVTVVVEDLEALVSPVVLDELGLLVERAPDDVRFIFVSRDDRLPRIPRLLMRDGVAEIRRSALALTVDEVGETIRRFTGRRLHPVQVQALHARTEGWAAGVHLAALGLRDHVDPDGFVADFAGDDRHVADYLSGEVLAVLSPEVTDFLVHTSVLDRLSGPLCDAVMGGKGGQRLLDHLERRSLFIQPMDDHRQWYTLHPLFRDLLHYELRATGGSDERELLTRAAAWHLEHDEVDAAAEYLIRAEDWPAVIALARREGGRYYVRGEASTVLRWLDEVPTQHLMASPETALTKVVLHTMCGSSLAAQELLDRLESTAPLVDDGHRALAAAARASWVFYHLPPEAAEVAADEAMALLDEGIDQPDGPLLDVLTPVALRALALVSRSVACWSRADYAGVRRLLGQVIDHPAPVVWLVNALGELAWTEASTGNLRLALTLARRSIDAAAEVGLEHHQATAMAHMALCLAHRERGEAAATGHLETAMARARLTQRSRVISLEWSERAHAALVEGRVADGLDEIMAARVAGGPPLAPVVSARLVALEVRLCLHAGTPARGRAALDAHSGIVTGDLLGATAALATATDDLGALRKAVEEWPVDRTEPAARWAHGLWAAVLADREGDRQEALSRLQEVVVAAEAEGAVRPFLDAGPEIVRLVRMLYHDNPTSFVRRLTEDVPPAGPRTSAELIEQLTKRELVVLRYLPSRLSNADIAARLYVSVNTLKTHLKNIYRKLAVSDRGEAIERAEDLGLL